MSGQLLFPSLDCHAAPEPVKSDDELRSCFSPSDLRGDVFSFEVFGDRGMFTNPVSRGGSNFFSYPVPTYESLKGIAKHIYWKPSMFIEVERVRVMNKVDFFKSSRKLRRVNRTGALLSTYLYLNRPRYQVQVRLCMNFRADQERYSSDFACGVGKHLDIFRRSLEVGGRLPICLGTSECNALVRPCEFGSGDGFYDDVPESDFGVQFFGFDYENESGRAPWPKPGRAPSPHSDRIVRYFSHYVMRHGVLEFGEFDKMEDSP